MSGCGVVVVVKSSLGMRRSALVVALVLKVPLGHRPFSADRSEMLLVLAPS